MSLTGGVVKQKMSGFVFYGVPNKKSPIKTVL